MVMGILAITLLEAPYLLAFATSIEPGQPARPCGLSRLGSILLVDQFLVFILTIPKTETGQFQKWKVNYSIE